MKIIKAWVQVEIELDEDEYTPQKLSSLISEAVDDGAAQSLKVFSSPYFDAPHVPTIHCSCGCKLDDLGEPCWKCDPEANDWFWQNYEEAVQ